MSMGSRLCIPPMTLPPTMQHLQIPHMAHFPHLGMGLGYGMGVLDMNNTATVPLSPMPGAHFPCQMIPGTAPQGLGMPPGRNTPQMFRVPGQPIYPPVSGVQPFSSLASHPVRQNLAPQVSATVANMVQEQQVSNQQQQSLNEEGMQRASTGDSQLQTILQVSHKQVQTDESNFD
jgi:phytochrome-interacting factor 3